MTALAMTIQYPWWSLYAAAQLGVMGLLISMPVMVLFRLLGSTLI